MSPRVPALLRIGALAIGLILLAHGANQWRLGRAASAWPATSGSVTQSNHWKRNKKHSLTYTYSVDGREFTGTRKQFGESGGSPRHGDFVKLVVGDVVSVHYQPGNPAVSTLKPGPHGNVWFFTGLGAVFVAGALFRGGPRTPPARNP